MMPPASEPLIAEIVHRDMPPGPCVLTAILVIVGDFSSAEKSLRCLAQQSLVHEMELIVASDSREALEDASPYLASFQAVQLIRGDVRRLPHLRAACAERALSPIVAFNEDHSFVEPGWAAEILATFDSKPYVDAAAACMDNPNPHHPVSRAQFTVFFSRFSPAAWPAGRHTVNGLPWHNTVYRASALHAVTDAGGNVGTDLEVEGSLQAAIRRELPHGQFVLTTGTTIHHVNVSQLVPACRHAILGGRLYAADRALREGWSLTRRLLQSCGAPLVPLIRLFRDQTTLRAVSRGPVDYLSLMVHYLVLAIAHAGGEVIGLVFGSTEQHVMHYAGFECRRARYVQPSERALLAT